MLYIFTDDNAHRLAENSALVTTGTRSAQDRQILRIWYCRPTSSYGYVCSYRALARLFMVRQPNGNN